MLSKVSAVQWLNERAVKANVVMRSREMIDIMTAVLGGIGLSVLPCWIGDAEPLLRRLTNDVVAVQSSVVAFHGFEPAGLPPLMLQKKLMMNGICASASPNAQ